MDHLCPICQRKLLVQDEREDHIDYHCFPSQEDHHYSKRMKGDQITLLKIRIGSEGEKIFLKVNFEEKYSQIWTRPRDESARVKIDHIIEPDLTDLIALKKKLRTYLTFS